MPYRVRCRWSNYERKFLSTLSCRLVRKIDLDVAGKDPSVATLDPDDSLRPEQGLACLLVKGRRSRMEEKRKIGC